MDSNWLAVFGAVLIAIAGGLAFVAYRHPAAFRENLGIPLAVFTTVAFIFLSFWNLGALHAQSEALLNAVKGSGSSTSATVSSLLKGSETHTFLKYMDCSLPRRGHCISSIPF